jgi:hypothetical protein
VFGRAQHGTPDTGPDTGLWLLHPHERVLTADENRRYSSTDNSVGDIYVSLNLGGVSVQNSGNSSDAVTQLLRALDTNRDRIRDKIRAAVVPNRQKLIIK